VGIARSTSSVKVPSPRSWVPLAVVVEPDEFDLVAVGVGIVLARSKIGVELFLKGEGDGGGDGGEVVGAEGVSSLSTTEDGNTADDCLKEGICKGVTGK
jgi:hypothetical protein